MRQRLPAVAAVAALIAGACAQPPRRLRDKVGILLPSDVRSLDPNAIVEQATDAVLVNVFEPLVGLDENLRVEPVLAESWEQASAESAGVSGCAGACASTMARRDRGTGA
jgi:ABC-type transport system substrate-binding protein